MNIAIIAPHDEGGERWRALLERALPGDRFMLWPAIDDPSAVEVVLVAKPPPGAVASFPRLKLIQSLWMGVDGLLADATLPRDVPLARLVDPGMVAAMSEMVLACVLDWHRHLYRYRALQRDARWQPLPQSLASDRTVGILGLGELGRHAAATLVSCGFNVLGWSRSERRIDAVETFHGAGGLRAMLPRCEALVCLLPLTDETRGIIAGELLAQLPAGAVLMNFARGAHVTDDALLAALDSGHIAHAWLDVFNAEPLPTKHRYWPHPRVTLTPHIAALTEPRTALAVVLDNLERVRRGAQPAALVDRGSGY